MDYVERITLDPAKLGGKPCIRGLRITVYDILEYLAGGMSEQEILQDFPDLEVEMMGEDDPRVRAWSELDRRFPAVA